MKAIKTEISGIEVLIQASDIEIVKDYTSKPLVDLEAIQTISNDDMGIYKKTSSPPVIPKETLENVSNVISAFAKDCKEQFDKHDHSPNEVEIEYSLSLNAKTSVWVIGAEAQAGIKVRMKWEKN